MSSSSRLRKQLAATEATSLTLRARQLASGWAAGTHRADRKGSGVEFAGHRAYTPGDDLRHLDRHALLRHQKLLVREFLTDTERAVHIVVDATASMRYRGSDDSAPNKAELALLLAAALAFVAHNSGDHVGLSTISASGTTTFKPRAGREALERILHHLEQLEEETDSSAPSEQKADAEVAPIGWAETFHTLGSALPRGTLIFVLSDFLDANLKVSRSLAALSTLRRTVRAAQILTSDEVEFPFDGSVRLQDLESGRQVETEAAGVRKQYQEALAELTSTVQEALEHQGGLFIRAQTDDSPGDTLRRLASGAASEMAAK